MMKAIFFGILFVLNLNSYAQKSPNLNNSLEVWRVLRAVKYEAKENGVYQPTFSQEIEKLAGKKVTLEGFMIVIQHERKPKNFMLSFFPVNSCFFCGAAGPETVIEIVSERAVTYTDDPISVSGILKLNAKDENRLFFILEKAEPND